MARYEVIESKAWKRDDGRTASLYGAVPWTSPSEEKRWKVVTRGYTVRDNVQGTVGIGRQPWATRAEAQEWVDKANTRLADLARSRGAQGHATKKTSKPLGGESAAIDVVFRVFPEGDVIALFPRWNEVGGTIMSYQHLGQHGSASPSLVRELRSATAKEYAPLLAELKRLGYVPRVLKREP